MSYAENKNLVFCTFTVGGFSTIVGHSMPVLQLASRVFENHILTVGPSQQHHKNLHCYERNINQIFKYCLQRHIK